MGGPTLACPHSYPRLILIMLKSSGGHCLHGRSPKPFASPTAGCFHPGSLACVQMGQPDLNGGASQGPLMTMQEQASFHTRHRSTAFAVNYGS